MASFYRVNSGSSRLPSKLSALEEQSFLFQLQLQDKDEEESSEVGRNLVDQLCVFSPIFTILKTEIAIVTCIYPTILVSSLQLFVPKHICV